jgi:hypothetical protein
MSRSGKQLASSIALSLALASFPAIAASPADVGTARELYKQGADALDAGNPTAAVDKLAAAWAWVHTPVIGFALARAHHQLGHLVECREMALAVVRLPKAPDETALSASARAGAEQLAATIAPRIAHLSVAIAGAGVENTTVTLDGAPVPPAALRIARQANPGPHTVKAETADGRHGEVTVTLAEAETKEATVTISPVSKAEKPPERPVAVAVTPSLAGETAAPPVSSRRGVSPVVWIGVVASGVGFATTAVFGGIAYGKKRALSSQCTLQNASDDGKSVCPASSSDDLSWAQTAGTIATIGAVTMGVGLATVVTGLLLRGGGGGDGTRSRASVSPMIGPVSGVTGTF